MSRDTRRPMERFFPSRVIKSFPYNKIYCYNLTEKKLKKKNKKKTKKKIFFFFKIFKRRPVGPWKG